MTASNDSVALGDHRRPPTARRMLGEGWRSAGRWREAAKGAHQAWIKEMDSKGRNGKQMFADLLAMVKKYSN